MSSHIKVIAWLYIAFGILGFFVGLLVMFGMIVGGAASGSIGGFAALTGLGSVIALLIAAVSLPGLLAGYGLLKRRPWARILAIVLAVLQLLNIPFGTVFGIYCLWTLLSTEGEAQFRAVY